MAERGLTLDAGALVAIEREVGRVGYLVSLARQEERELHVLPEVLAQVWRGGAGRQHALATFLGLPGVTVPMYDEFAARAVGVLCGLSGHADVVDVHVVVHAKRRGHAVVTSDPEDLRRVDPTLRIIEV